MKIWLLRSSSGTASDQSAHHTWEAAVAYRMVTMGLPAILLLEEQHHQKQSYHDENHHTIHHHCLGFLDEALSIVAFVLGRLA